MSHVIPAVIPESKEHLQKTLASFASFAPEAQVDITDGKFAGIASWPYTEGSLDSQLLDLALPVSIELDLMILNPEDSLDTWLTLAPSRIVVHLEAVENLESVFAHRKNNSYKLGLAINNDTPLESLFSIDPLDYDYVELMGIDTIGVQGQPFDERVLTRIREIKATYLDLEISIDGSVNETTLPLLRDAGADRFVAGSAILKAPNPEEMYKKLAVLGA